MNLGLRDVCMLWFWLFMELEMYKRYTYEDIFSREPKRTIVDKQLVLF